MPKCPNCHAETQPMWRVCPHCEQPLPMGVPCPQCGKVLASSSASCPDCQPSRSAGLSSTDSVMRAGNDIVGGDKNEGDLRRAGGASMGGSINVNVETPPVESGRSIWLVALSVVAVLALALLFGMLVLVALTRTPQSPGQVVIAPPSLPAVPEPRPVPDPQPQLAAPQKTPVHESRIQDAPATGEIIVTAFGVQMPSESESRTAVEENVRNKARNEARKLVENRLAAFLAPDELTALGSAVTAWTVGKLVTVAERVESEGGALVARYEGRTSLTEFGEFLSARRKAQLSNKERETPLSIDFGIYRSDKRLIQDGGTLSSGDRFSIKFIADKDCHVYVINEEADGNLQVLYPHPATNNKAFVQGGETVWLPGEDIEYMADNRPGREKITIIASLAPLSDIEYFAERYDRGLANEGDKIVYEAETRKRGICVVAKMGAKDGMPEFERLSGKGCVVRTVTLEHN